MKKLLSKNIYLATIAGIYKVLDSGQRNKCVLIVLFIIVNGVIDVLGIAFILPVLYLANDTSPIRTNEYLNRLYNLFDFQDPDHFLLMLVGALVLVFLFKNIVGVLINYHQSRFAFRIGIEITTHQFKRYLSRDFLYFKNTNSNVIMRDLATIPLEFSSCVLQPTIMFTTELFVLLLITSGILLYNATVFVMLFVLLFPVFLLFYYSLRDKIHNLGNQKNDVRPITFKNIFETIFGYVDVKLSNRENYFVDKSTGLLRKFYGILTKLHVIEALPIRLIEITAIAGIAVLYTYFILTGDNRTELIGLLVIFALAAYRLMPSISRMMNALIVIKSNSYVFDVLKDENDNEPRPVNGALHEVPRFVFRDKLTLRDIVFQYPGTEKPVLNNINFEINKGDRIGIIGSSGSGKTTLVNLILRFLKEQNGQIQADDKVLGDQDIDSWRSVIGYVSQDFYMLDTNLAENIAFGEDPDRLDVQKLNNCLEQASMVEFVDKLKDGIYTEIGEFGSKLSGGQRQRIAIARALYKDPEILIFDEATSSLDNETEADILETVSNLSSQKFTMIVIAHRLTSLKHCDRIYELINGSFDKSYSYQELMLKDR